MEKQKTLTHVTKSFRASNKCQDLLLNKVRFNNSDAVFVRRVGPAILSFKSQHFGVSF